MKKILIVEDNIEVASIYKKEFQMDGYEVILASNGKEGLEKAKNEKPNLILLDIIMPVMNGLEMLKRIKKDSATKYIPVIIMTVLGDEKNTKKGLSLGAVDYLVKTEVLPSEVVEKSRKILEGDKIIIIEKNTRLAKNFQKMLSDKGFNVGFINDGKKCINKIITSKPSLILLSLETKIFDSFRILETIKSNSKIKNIPVIILSNSFQKDDANKAKLLGAADYIIKNQLNSEETIKRLREIIKKTHELNQISIDLGSISYDK